MSSSWVYCQLQDVHYLHIVTWNKQSLHFGRKQVRLSILPCYFSPICTEQFAYNVAQEMLGKKIFVLHAQHYQYYTCGHTQLLTEDSCLFYERNLLVTWFEVRFFVELSDQLEENSHKRFDIKMGLGHYYTTIVLI